jgi:hypothetical protein
MPSSAGKSRDATGSLPGLPRSIGIMSADERRPEVGETGKLRLEV